MPARLRLPPAPPVRLFQPPTDLVRMSCRTNSETMPPRTNKSLLFSGLSVCECNNSEAAAPWACRSVRSEKSGHDVDEEDLQDGHAGKDHGVREIRLLG